MNQKVRWLTSVLIALVSLLATPPTSGFASEPSNGVAPANTEPPVASWNGYEFSCSTGGWTGSPSPSFSYQWWQGQNEIPGAVDANYTPAYLNTALGGFVCEVSASNPSGTAAARSAALTGPFLSCCDRPVQVRPPALLTPPAITGAALPGGTLSCSSGTWASPLTLSYTYRWLSDGAVIEGASTSSLDVPALAEGTMLSCEVTASNALASATARSPALAVRVPTNFTGIALAEHRICGRWVRLGQSRTVQATLAAGLECSTEHPLRLIGKSPHLSLVFEARESGVLAASWYLRPPRTRSASSKRKLVLVAHGRMAYIGSDTDEALFGSPTRAGRALLGHRRRFALIAKASFTPEGAARVSVTERLVVHVGRPDRHP